MVVIHNWRAQMVYAQPYICSYPDIFFSIILFCNSKEKTFSYILIYKYFHQKLVTSIHAWIHDMDLCSKCVQIQNIFFPHASQRPRLWRYGGDADKAQLQSIKSKPTRPAQFLCAVLRRQLTTALETSPTTRCLKDTPGPNPFGFFGSLFVVFTAVVLDLILLFCF